MVDRIAVPCCLCITWTLYGCSPQLEQAAEVAAELSAEMAGQSHAPRHAQLYIWLRSWLRHMNFFAKWAARLTNIKILWYFLITSRRPCENHRPARKRARKRGRDSPSSRAREALQ